MWRVLTRLLHRSIVASFSGRPAPRPTAKAREGRGTRALRCAGLARACANWPRNWAVAVTALATVWWPSCCTNWVIACRQTPRLWKALRILIANAQFEHIHRKVRRFLRQGQPVISFDTKKKELVGDFKNRSEERREGKECRCRWSPY